jgi:hypothetical protein
MPLPEEGADRRPDSRLLYMSSVRGLPLRRWCIDINWGDVD